LSKTAGRLGRSADRRQRLHQPEGADRERDGRVAEAVVDLIAEEPAVLDQRLADRVDRAAQPRVAPGEEAQARHLQHDASSDSPP